MDLPKFKLILRDFLIQLKEFSGDNSELYAEERDDAQKAAQVAERERLAKVGGLLKPADLDQDDELWLDKEFRSETSAVKKSDLSTVIQRTPVTFPQATGGDGLNGWALYDL